MEDQRHEERVAQWKHTGAARLRLLGILAANLAWLGAHCPVLAEQVPVPVEQAALSEDWPRVCRLTAGAATNGSSATVRLIRGHACLAQNLNNESFALFLSVSPRGDLAEYGGWAATLAEHHPDKVISHYFQGDALARQKNWAAASAAFDAALKLQPKHAMALNARGVVHARQAKIRPATEDFAAAIEASKGSFADPYSNDGYLLVQRKQGAKGAHSAFAKAIQCSPEFALALHGRGCIELITARYEQAKQDLELADSKGRQFLEVMYDNEARFAAYAVGLKPDELLAALDEPGMSLRTRTELASSAKRDFAIAGKLEQMSALPFNKHLSGFFDGMGMRKSARLEAEFGAGTAKNALSSQEIGRGVSYANRQLQSKGSFAADYAVNLMETAAAGVPSSKGSINYNGMAKQLLTRQISIQKDWGTLNDRYSTLMSKQYGTEYSKPQESRLQNPAGVLASVKFQDSTWPFVPLYGLGYGLGD
jgi:tetratricopeptide (TPR) repeat protein